MLLYEKFGFQIKFLTKEYGAEIFRLLADSKLSKDREPEMYAKDRRILKNEIRFALTEKNYNPIGLFKNNILIGISFSSIVKDENIPWLGYFFIHKNYRKGKAFIVLANYIINHLYKGLRVQLGPTDMSLYKKVVKRLPKILEFSVFQDDLGPRLKRICKEE